MRTNVLGEIPEVNDEVIIDHEVVIEDDNTMEVVKLEYSELEDIEDDGSIAAVKLEYGEMEDLKCDGTLAVAKMEDGETENVKDMKLKIEDYESEREKLQNYEVKEETMCLQGEIEDHSEVINSKKGLKSEEELLYRESKGSHMLSHKAQNTTIHIIQEESNDSLSNYGVNKCSDAVEYEPQESSINGEAKISYKNLRSNEIQEISFDERNLKSLENLPNPSLSYQCVECSQIFLSFSCFDDHVQQVKSFTFHVTCKQCFKPFETFCALTNHMQVKHSTEKVLCEECPDLGEFKNNIALKRHKKEAHALNCKICKKVFYDLGKLDKHMDLKHGTRFHCGVCEKITYSKKARRAHELIHNDSSEICWICGLVVKNSKILNKHIRKHNGEKHHCNVCNKVFPSLMYLRRHEENHLQKNPKCHICHICPKMFSKKSILDRHILMHSKKDFVCVCGKRFMSNAKLVMHEKRREALGGSCIIRQFKGTRNIQTNNQISNTLVERCEKSTEECISVVCDICGRNFIKTFNAIRHKKYHFCQGNPDILQKLLNEPEVYKCEECGKVCYTKYALQFHSAVKHTKVAKPFACEFCPKKFRTRPQIMVHERIHSGERPYPCTTCSKSFQTKTHLRHHEHVHSKERRFLCPLCGLGFKSSSGLMEHTFRHDDAVSVRRFPCLLCGNRFMSEKVLKAHFTRNHSEESLQDIKLDKDKEGFKCDECGKILVSKVALRKHEKRMHRNCLVEMPGSEINLDNVVMTTLPIEDSEDGLDDDETEQQVNYSDDYVEMTGSNVE